MNTPVQLSAGTIFSGEFRIIRPLSAGGMGAVYIAEQASTGKLRALKLMHPTLLADARLRERFEQEARVGALIKSNHVVQVIGAGVDRPTGVPWLAMELLEGEDLAACIRQRGRLPPGELYNIFRQIGHALGAAHAVGVVHRDLKPENIFLARSQDATGQMAVKILDFGIAKVVAEAKTMATAALGTPLWMAPEQTDPRVPIIPATDVWPLGLIAFMMLTGRAFWRTATDPMAGMTALMREILIDPMPPASQRAAELGAPGTIPPGFDAWFARCTVRDPRGRFATAAEALEALGPALTASTTGAPMTFPSTPPPFMPPTPAQPWAPAPAPAPASPPQKTPVVLIIAALAGVVSVIAGLTFVVRSGGQANAPTDPRPGAGAQGPAESPGAATPSPVVAPETTAAPTSTAAAASTWPKPGATAKPNTAPKPAPSSNPTTASARRDFNVVAANQAIADANWRATVHCQGRDGPKAVSAMVTFDPGGGVRNVFVNPPATGTPSGLCGSQMLFMMHVPPFDGEPKQMAASVAIP